MDSEDLEETGADDQHDVESSQDNSLEFEDRSQPESQDSQTSAALAGFLFGNIDEKGELEEDFLDEVCI